MLRRLALGWAAMFVVGYVAHLIGTRLLVGVPFPATTMAGIMVVGVVVVLSLWAYWVGDLLLNEVRARASRKREGL